MKLHWSQEAIIRLEAIQAFISQHNQTAAESEVRRIIFRAHQLVDAPRMGREVPEYHHPDVREILERPYRIIYRLCGQNIEILSVMHYRQLLPADLQEFLGN